MTTTLLPFVFQAVTLRRTHGMNVRLSWLVLLIALTVPTRTARADDGDSRAPGFYRDTALPAGQVILTFDDGPFRRRTPAILDMLDQHRFPAAFFLVGRNINRNTYQVVQQIEAAGHIIGSHSYNHDVAMATRRDSVAYIRGQHEATHILIEIALLARSPADFDGMSRRVFQHDPQRWLPAASLRHFQPYVARHGELLTERGFAQGRYHVRYSRPPAGNPYHSSEPAARASYDEALRELSVFNVMWHSESGDAHEASRRDFGALTRNLERGARQGGVILIHDYIRHDALRHALETIATLDGIRTVSLDDAVAAMGWPPSPHRPLASLRDQQ